MHSFSFPATIDYRPALHDLTDHPRKMQRLPEEKNSLSWPQSELLPPILAATVDAAPIAASADPAVGLGSS